MSETNPENQKNIIAELYQTEVIENDEKILWSAWNSY